MRAVGVVRVSQARGREGDKFASPEDQRERIKATCERDGFDLVAVHDEIDISGGNALAKRPGLSEAVSAVEAGDAEIVIVAYFDRLVRSLRVQDEVVSRVEEAGGRVMAIDFGRVTGATAVQWLSGTMVGAVHEYFRRSAKERSAEAQAMAVARGVAPWPNIPPGYIRGEDGRLEPDVTALAVAEAFAMRSRGTTVKAIRAYLAEHGVRRSFHSIVAMLRSRVYLGEIHFGNLENLEAHPPIIERDLWLAVQRVSVPTGRRARSDRLLARLGVLRCASCGSRMVVATSHNSKYWVYRCPTTGDCPQRVSISAEIAETVVVEAVLAAIADEEGRASTERNAEGAVAQAKKAQADFDAAIRVFSGLEDEASARERLAELRAERDRTREHADHLAGLDVAKTIRAGADWPRLSLEGRRALIRAVVEAAFVSPGKGPSRIRVELFTQ